VEMREQHSSLEETDDQNCNRTNHLIRFVHDLKTTVTLINFLGFFFPDSFSQQVVGIIWSKNG
jgi:hypothetical protein